MRYIVAIASAVLVLLFLGATTGFGDWPRPWGPLAQGAVGGGIAIGVLIVWEQLYPRDDEHHDGVQPQTTVGEFDDAEVVVDETASPAEPANPDETASSVEAANLDEAANSAEAPEAGDTAHPDDDPRT